MEGMRTAMVAYPRSVVTWVVCRPARRTSVSLLTGDRGSGRILTAWRPTRTPSAKHGDGHRRPRRAGWQVDGLRCASDGLAPDQRSDDWIAVALGPDGEERRVRDSDPFAALDGLVASIG
jgi:hypothetical protein